MGSRERPSSTHQRGFKIVVSCNPYKAGVVCRFSVPKSPRALRFNYLFWASFLISIILVSGGIYLLHAGYYRRLVYFVRIRAAPLIEMFADNSPVVLAQPGSAYLAYVRKTVNLDLTATSGVLSYEWYNPSTGETIDSGQVEGGAVRTFSPPGSGDFVLWVRAASAARTK